MNKYLGNDIIRVIGALVASIVIDAFMVFFFLKWFVMPHMLGSEVHFLDALGLSLLLNGVINLSYIKVIEDLDFKVTLNDELNFKARFVAKLILLIFGYLVSLLC